MCTISNPKPAHIVADTKPRIDPTSVATRDWNNDLQSLVLDIDEQLKKTADPKQKAVIVRKLKRALASSDEG
jgi:metallo-beta-lactamase family protein